MTSTRSRESPAQNVNGFCGRTTPVSMEYMEEGFPGGSVVKNPCPMQEDTGGAGSIPGSGRCPGGENGNSLQYPCRENPMDRAAWRAAVQGLHRAGHDLGAKQQQPGGHCRVAVTEQVLSQRHRRASLPVSTSERVPS